MSNQTRGSIRKGLVAATATAIGMANAIPSIAFATEKSVGWGPDDIAKPKKDTSKFEAQGIAPLARSIVHGFLFIAVAIFVLKIILTAVDRLILAGGSSDESFRLDDVPLVGAYRDPERDVKGGQTGAAWTWSRIWAHFALQVGLCVSAWVITELLMGVISSVIGATGA